MEYGNLTRGLSQENASPCVLRVNAPTTERLVPRSGGRCEAPPAREITVVQTLVMKIRIPLEYD